MKKHTILIILFALLTTLQLAYANTDARIEQFDKLISHYYNAGLFTGGVLIAEHGNIIFKKTYGLANREDGTANESTTKFRIDSISKQFTATAIMLLQQQGKLSVHDTIRKYIPDYPSIGDKITIHHLLTHTSGIPEYTIFGEPNREIADGLGAILFNSAYKPVFSNHQGAFNSMKFGLYY